MDMQGVVASRCVRPFAAGLLLMAGTIAMTAADRFPAAEGDILVTPLIHSSVQLEYRGRVIQVDPWSAGPLHTAKPADLILVTDDVRHHLDGTAIAMLRKPGAPVVIASNGLSVVPDGIVMANGESRIVAGIQVEAIAAYDIMPGEPAHPKGEANGYVLTLGGKRLLFAGVTECVDELRAVRNVDIAFMPMNIPPGRMTPAAAADCTRALNPKVVYLYHYDQDYAAAVANPQAVPRGLPGGLSIAQSLSAFRQSMIGTAVEIRDGNWYPPR